MLSATVVLLMYFSVMLNYVDVEDPSPDREEAPPLRTPPSWAPVGALLRPQTKILPIRHWTFLM